MRAEVAIIGGTGVGDQLQALGGRGVHVSTPFGQLSGRIVEIGGKSTLLIARHSRGHKKPPHAVAYRAFAWGARALGVRACLATAAVGGLKAEYASGTILVAHDFLDFTSRNLTLFEQGVVHTDFSEPFALAENLRQAAAAEGIPARENGVYVCANGPRYETPEEVRWFAQWGDVVGMTSTSEAIAFRESGIDYGLICVVTNPGAGISATALNHEEVTVEMKRQGANLVRILKRAVTDL